MDSSEYIEQLYVPENQVKDKIEKAIRETLVVENKQSIYLAVERIYKLFNEREKIKLVSEIKNKK